jgi:hypothetical protein
MLQELFSQPSIQEILNMIQNEYAPTGSNIYFTLNAVKRKVPGLKANSLRGNTLLLVDTVALATIGRSIFLTNQYITNTSNLFFCATL